MNFLFSAFWERFYFATLLTDVFAKRKKKWFFKNAVLSRVVVYSDSHNKGFCAFMWSFILFLLSFYTFLTPQLPETSCDLLTWPSKIKA